MSRDKELVRILSHKFGLTENLSQLDTESEFFKRLQILLAAKIERLIQTDVERLLQILYQVDIDQAQTDQAFDLGEVKKISMDLAEKIIRRQLQKIDYARKFYQED